MQPVGVVVHGAVLDLVRGENFQKVIKQRLTVRTFQFFLIGFVVEQPEQVEQHTLDDALHGNGGVGP